MEEELVLLKDGKIIYQSNDIEAVKEEYRKYPDGEVTITKKLDDGILCL